MEKRLPYDPHPQRHVYFGELERIPLHNIIQNRGCYINEFYHIKMAYN